MGEVGGDWFSSMTCSSAAGQTEGVLLTAVERAKSKAERFCLHLQRVSCMMKNMHRAELDKGRSTHSEIPQPATLNQHALQELTGLSNWKA